jgi:endoglucanase
MTRGAWVSIISVFLAAAACETGDATPDTGAAGTSGAAGSTGVAGTTGAAGTSGVAGTTAAAGTTGSAGTAASAAAAPAGSPVALHGTLRAQGNRIVDASGQPVQLKGMSLYWSHFAAGAPFYNADVVKWLAQDWKAGVVRAAIGVTGDNDGDYLQGPEKQLALLDAVVQGAFEAGVYVLIDWHDHHAPQHLDAAKGFFDKAAQRYGARPNVIYEIWNEPRGNEGLTWTKDLKPYADTISKEIRRHDTKNLMVVGTPFWDQQPNAVLGAPVDDPNVAYTLHFYAGYDPHKLSGDVGKNAKAALAGGLPLFVTEWGSVDPGAQTMFNETETRAWMKFLDENEISSCNWSISAANEGSSALRQGVSTKGGWPESDLSQSGKLVRSLIRD